MIIPHPESDMSLNLMVVASDILSILHENEYVLIDNAFKEFISRDARRTPAMFFNAVTYLFSLGIIKEQNYKMRIVNGDTQTTLY
jgi:hypothetical protein